MKVGDQLVVSLEGHQVGMATIEDISDGKATIIIPATRVVMGVKQSLTELAPETDRVFAGVAEGGGSEESPAVQETNEEAPKSLREMDLDTTALDKE